jgi:hypothetical protein
MTADMQTEGTFTDAGWDFTGETANGTEDMWTIYSFGGNYPRFLWEQPRVYHVSAADGNDNNGGFIEASALKTIQAGIGVALGGEKVLVWPGVYSEKLDFLGKAITVEGAEDGAVISALAGYAAASFVYGEDANTVFENFVIRGSDAALFFVGSSPTINHLTVADNNAGAIADEFSVPIITNSIFWNNRDGDLLGCDAQYSCIETGGAGLGNITTDPCFVDADNGDYHLKSQGWRWSQAEQQWVFDDATSRCIDAGNPGTPLGYEPMNVPRDPDNTYGVNIRVNMGAYGGTSQASIGPAGWALLADLNNDGIIGWLDAGLWVQYWLAAGSELPADLDRNDTINGFDWALFGQDWSSETLWR